MCTRNLFILLAGLILLGCGKHTIGGNGKVTTQIREVESFNSISISGAYDVCLKQGDTQSVVIECDENLLPIIESVVTDSTLVIKNSKNIIRSKSLKINITVIDVKTIDFSGATELFTDSILHLNSLKINLSGAGKVDLFINSNELGANVSGGAELNFKGQTKNLVVSITGAGNIVSDELETEKCTIDISGFGRARINATKELVVNISGAGKVEYKGEPIIKQSITGAGKVKKII